MKISFKLTLISVATTAAAILCVLVAFFVQDLRVVRQVKAEQVETQLSMLVGNLAYALTNSDLRTVDTLLKNATSEHGIVSAIIYNKSGEVLSRYRYSHTGTPANDDFDTDMFSFSVHAFSRDIISQDAKVASLAVDVSYADVEMRLLYMVVYSAMAFVFSLVLAGILSWFIQRLVSRPLLRLHSLSQNVFETGNYGLRAEVTSQDELGQLSDAINRMLNQIQSRDTMMEKRVNQRTRELQKLAEDFRYRALHDSLTGLPNRAFLNEEFNRAVAHSKRVGKSFAVLMLDLDNFKEINDSCGHHVGDELLKLVAHKIRGALRGGDIVCRLGGDEFIVLLEGVRDTQRVEAVVASCIFKALEGEVSLVGQYFEIGVSVGASLYPIHGEDLSELKRNADIAMYRAKAGGKNRLAIYDPIMDKQSINRETILRDLQNAVERHELHLNYQPQVDTRNHALVGCEVFVRWQHPIYGLMLPNEFTQFAEDSGVIKKIDYFVIKEACKQSQKWLSQYQLRVPVSVNISSFHFRSNELVAEVRDILHQTQMPAYMLTLELSESALMNKSSMVDSVVDSLRNIGVKVALDGFAGYCSLAHLGSLNVDSIKLNQSLFQSISQGESQKRLAKGILAFTHQLKVKLVVEGVEVHKHIPILTKLGCSVVQGYVYSKPLSRDDFLLWAKRFLKDQSVPIVTQIENDDMLVSDLETESD